MLTRRDFVTASAGCALSNSAWGQNRERLYDILIKNGEVRDPVRGYKGRADVAILDGKIAAIENSIPVEKGRDVINAAGLYVVPA
jgi:N-acyl-D-aspartate/D-glutamate deacylase